MSQPAFKALDLPFELVVDDGIPMDNFLHPIQVGLFRDLVGQLMAERGRNDYCVGGNNFVYCSMEQARDVARGRSHFRGLDIFFVDQVPPRRRKAWVSWEEGGRMPDLIIELLSPSTKEIDRNDKMDLYAKDFRTREYYLYDYDTRLLEGYRLAGTVYQPARPDSQGRFRSDVLGVDVGLWHGAVEQQEEDWIRLFHPDGRMIPTSRERAEAERQRAEAECQRANAAEAELARLRALLDERKDLDLPRGGTSLSPLPGFGMSLVSYPGLTPRLLHTSCWEGG